MSNSKQLVLEGDWTDADEEAIKEALANAGLQADKAVVRGDA